MILKTMHRTGGNQAVVCRSMELCEEVLWMEPARGSVHYSLVVPNLEAKNRHVLYYRQTMINNGFSTQPREFSRGYSWWHLYNHFLDTSLTKKWALLHQWFRGKICWDGSSHQASNSGSELIPTALPLSIGCEQPDITTRRLLVIPGWSVVHGFIAIVVCYYGIKCCLFG